MSSPRLQIGCRLALNLSHIIFLEAEVELFDPAPCHRPSIKADLPQHTLRSPFFKKGERHSSQRALCITSTIPQHTQEASFPSWRVCQNHFKTDKKFYSIAFPNSCRSHISAYEPLPQAWHLWSHSNTTNTTGRSQEKMWNYLQTFWASRIGSRRGVSLSLLHLCTVHMLSEDWKWQKRQRFNK